MQKTAQGELFMISSNGLVTSVGPPFRPARHRVTDGGARLRPYPAVLMVDSFVPAYTTITWTVWPLGKPATSRGDPTPEALTGVRVLNADRGPPRAGGAGYPINDGMFRPSVSHD